MKKTLLVSLISFLLCGCSFPPRLYQDDVRQGRHLKEKQLKQLRIGMSKDATRDIIGEPSIIGKNNNIWYYVYTFKSNSKKVYKSQKVTIVFKDNKIVSFNTSKILEQ